MSKIAVFTLKLEPELRDQFIAEAEAALRPASQFERELMPEIVQRQRGIGGTGAHQRSTIWILSAEELAVRAKPSQTQSLGIALSVDQQQIRLEVTFAVARPITGKLVIAVARIQGLIRSQCKQYMLKRVHECGAVLAPWLLACSLV
jgi:hypothetical protein